MAAQERPAEFAILGLLALEDAGSHGYDLARAFAGGEPLGEILRLEPGMLYHHLKRLERADCVSQSTTQTGGRPPRQIYRISETGRTRLFNWLQSPVEHTREIRLDFLVKLYFAQRLEPALARRLISTQLDTLLEVRAALSNRPSTAEAPADRFLESVRELRMTQTDAAINWLESLHGPGPDPERSATPSGMP
ncbi:MAG: PadR family transcriptional regulator [Thermomicrobiales bacterium]